MPESTLEKVRAARKIIQQKTQQKAELEGRRNQLMETLKRDFGFDTVAEAEKEADRLEAELRERNQEVLKLVTELDTKMKELET